MRITPLFVFVLLVLSVLSCRSNQKITKTYVGSDFPFDAVVSTWLGDSVKHIIESPLAVHAYKLKPQCSKQDALVGEYAVDSVIGQLDISYYAALQFFLKDSANYILTDENVKTPFSPNLGFEFVGRKHEKVYILLAFNGNQLEVLYHGDIIAHKMFRNKYFLLRFTEKLLPENEFIKRELLHNHQN